MSTSNSIVDTKISNVNNNEFYPIISDFSDLNYESTNKNFQNNIIDNQIGNEIITEAIVNIPNKLNFDGFREDIFSHKEYIVSEQWSSIVNIQSRVLDFTNDIVTCECLIDRDGLIFENRDFPMVLFKHINSLKDSFILISIKTNIGSIKINVYKGDQFVDKSLFIDRSSEIQAEWDKITQSNFIKPFKYDPK